LKLYHSSGSPNSRRVRILIVEKDLDIELAPIDLGAKEQFSDAYLAINPRAVVPTLVLDDGTAIGEVPAIMRYLDEAYPKVRLLGATLGSSECSSLAADQFRRGQRHAVAYPP